VPLPASHQLPSLFSLALASLTSSGVSSLPHHAGLANGSTRARAREQVPKSTRQSQPGRQRQRGRLQRVRNYLVGGVRTGIHHEARVGGYRVCLLMPKLPGEALSMNLFCIMLLEEREAVREAFELA